VIGVRALVALLLASAALLPTAGEAGPLYSEATLAEYFRLHWETAAGARGAAITGHVQNLATLPFDRIQLLVERLDAGGAVIGRSTTWVVGNLPANQRAYFSATVPPAAAYRVSISSFDWANCRD
jgi:hypothetical protein